MASENSNDNDNDWLGTVQERLESEFGKGCMTEEQKGAAKVCKVLALQQHQVQGVTKTSDEIVDEIVGQVKAMYKDELTSSKKQKVQQRKTPFFVTAQIAENGNKIETSSNNNDYWLGRVKERLESEFGEGCMAKDQKFYAVIYKEEILGEAKWTDEIVEQVVERIKTKYKAALTSSKKQKVQQRKNHFLVTAQIAENANKIEIATNLVFDNEPDSKRLLRRVREECHVVDCCFRGGPNPYGNEHTSAISRRPLGTEPPADIGHSRVFQKIPRCICKDQTTQHPLRVVRGNVSWWNPYVFP